MKVKLTKSQAAKIARLTNLCYAYNGDNGAISFTVEPAGRGSVHLFATNVHSDLRWFESVNDLYITIGPKGGVRTGSNPGTLAKWVIR